MGNKVVNKDTKLKNTVSENKVCQSVRVPLRASISNDSIFEGFNGQREVLIDKEIQIDNIPEESTSKHPHTNQEQPNYQISNKKDNSPGKDRNGSQTEEVSACKGKISIKNEES